LPPSKPHYSPNTRPTETSPVKFKLQDDGLTIDIPRLPPILVHGDLPPKFHPAAIRASAVFDKPDGAMEATRGHAKLSYCVALEPVAAMIPA
jgi:hypothetical protein